MVTTRIDNDTNSEIDVKEGNVGVYIPFQKLSKKGTKGSSCTITVDPNATYREYWIAALADNPGKPPIVVTSDDCIDNAVLTIEFDGTKYVCAQTPRNARRDAKPVTNSLDDSNAAPAKASRWRRFFPKW